ncbi:MAG TPA: type III-A CRISPR-associated protein Csm2 [Candidatus Desulfofervidus auxilii]|uniref:CRISPR system Cms protein Csm2 n=1 Tax=Desulfofervidus auxilii TaxID=1621989 RepID=A0A7V0IAU3_DESA2|nr:type III-A CRISPR-associated protein Csm2 [Candidatus Desulfofervidus auxilii]
MKHNYGSKQHNRRESDIKVPIPIHFFVDEKKTILRPSLLSDEAEKLSDFFVAKSNMSIHQLRKFYNQILAIKQRIENKENKDEEFKRQLPYIKMLKAQAAYARARKHVTDNFKLFMEKQIDVVDDKKDFDAFCELFEAIVAFAVANNKKYKNR